MLKQAVVEGFITDDTIAVDATHIEARDQAPAKQKKRKPKHEREAWLKKKSKWKKNRNQSTKKRLQLN
ncbi:hypothetical protein ABH899_002097 [Paenibacillus sp. RC84]